MRQPLMIKFTSFIWLDLLLAPKQIRFTSVCDSSQICNILAPYDTAIVYVMQYFTLFTLYRLSHSTLSTISIYTLPFRPVPKHNYLCRLIFGSFSLFILSIFCSSIRTCQSWNLLFSKQPRRKLCLKCSSSPICKSSRNGRFSYAIQQQAPCEAFPGVDLFSDAVHAKKLRMWCEPREADFQNFWRVQCL